MPQPPKKRIAQAQFPIIAAIVEGLYRFETREQAEKMLERVKRNHIISKHALPADVQPAVALWIKGYAITPEEAEKGVLGNFAILRVMEKGNKYTLTAAKLPIPPSQHPQRKRPPQKHPDWGNPILRAVKRRKCYATIEEARRELMLLHEQFPEASIPGTDKLQVIVYSKKERGQMPIEKITIRLEAQGEGGFCLVRQEMVDRRSMSPVIAHESPLPEGEEAVRGKYTTMVEMKRKRRPTKK